MKNEEGDIMTAAQIEAIIGSENMGGSTRLHIPSILYIAFKKDKNVVKADVNDVRFLFNTDTDLLEIVFCRPFSTTGQLPKHGNYDILDVNGVSTVFEYMTGENGLYVDFYAFDSITTIGLI
jgi:hypothetical protein